jgi:hypothetical protein
MMVQEVPHAVPRLEVWFRDWLKVHLKLHRHAGLPDPTTEEGRVEFRVWARKFREAEVTEAEATDASERLYGMAVHEARHFFTLLDMIAASRTGRELRVAEDPEATARRASRTCPECEGLGLAVRYRQRRPGPPVVLTCVCPLGRWLRDHGRGPDGCLDLADHAWLRGEPGEGYRMPPPPSPPPPSPPPPALAGAAAPGPSAWWRTGRAEPNSPES